MADKHPNLARSTVLTGPTPATSGTTIVVATGDGEAFTPPCRVTVWPQGASPTRANAEILRVTAQSGDTLTVTRHAETWPGSGARAISGGWNLSATITAGSLAGAYLSIDEHPPTPQQYRQAGDPDWTLGLQRMLDAGKTAAYVPPSSTPYDISATLAVPVGVDDLTLAPGATIRAVSAISGPMLSVYGVATQRRFGSTSGGTWDCNDLAQDGIALKWHWGHSITDVVVKDHLRDGVVVGTASSPGGSAQHKLRNVECFRSTTTALPVGSRGIVTVNSTDGTCTAVIVQSAETSFHTDSGGNQFYSCHGWSSATNINKTTFYDNGGNNDYLACCVDSPSIYGWHLKQWNTRIIGGFSLQPVPAVDNLAIAIHIDCGGPDYTGVVAGHYFRGGPTSRWMKDYDGTVPFPGLSVYGCTSEHVATPAIGGLQSLGTRMRIDATGNPTAVPLTVNADGSGTADLLRVLKGGTQRFSIDSYGVAYGVGAFYSDKVRMGNGTAIGGGVMSGTGSPNGVITGAAGDAWIRTDGATGSWIYRCTGGTAWTAAL